jgi:hypothetical protein
MEEDKKKDDNWISTCCGTQKVISKGFTQYILQAFISLFVLSWSCYQISKNNDNLEIYFSLISSILSLYITPPSMGNDK